MRYRAIECPPAPKTPAATAATRCTLLALDLERTVSADPPLWRGFLRAALARNHQIICVTTDVDSPGLRARHGQLLGSLTANVPLLCTDGQPKRAYALRCGYHVDIWIDDVPETVGAVNVQEVQRAEARFPRQEVACPTKPSNNSGDSI